MKSRLRVEDVDPSIATVAQHLRKAEQVLVIFGAGVSTAIGIPDFRSTNGIFRRGITSDTHNNRQTGVEMLSASNLDTEEKRTKFFQTMAALRRCVDECTKNSSTGAAHRFVVDLQEKGKLRLCITQNIDGLEKSAGLQVMNDWTQQHQTDVSCANDRGKVVQLHGDLFSVRCTACNTQDYWTDTITTMYQEGLAPRCDRCRENHEARVAIGKRRVLPRRPEILRPNVLLYHEHNLSGDDHGELLTKILREDIDMILIMGTELKIPSLSDFVSRASRVFKQCGHGRIDWINRTPVSKAKNRLVNNFYLMECEEWIEKVQAVQMELDTQDDIKGECWGIDIDGYNEFTLVEDKAILERREMFATCTVIAKATMRNGQGKKV